MRLTVILFALAFLALPATGQSTATYKVTFTSTWSAGTHPTDFPVNPHYSGMKGVTHNGSASFWAPGGMASPGIELMAEAGNNSTLNTEMDAAITATTAEFKIDGSGLDPSPGSISKMFDITEDYPLVTFVAMIAPSPDWFVGVHGENLFVGDTWVDKTITAFAYDAGTDDGGTYSSPNAESSPHIPIAQIAASPINGENVGSYTFELQSVLPVELASFTATADGNDALLYWTTLSETNNAGFAIEQSARIGFADNSPLYDSFTEVGYVAAKGNSSDEQLYNFRLDALAPGSHRFRLRQVDLDGTFEYSNIVEVSIDLPNAYALSSAYPNPFNPTSSFSLQVAETQQVVVELFDILGKRVASIYAGTLESGIERSFVIDGSQLGNGVYIYRVRGESFVGQATVSLIK